MCSNRSRSLRRSLINQQFVAFYTFAGKRSQRTVNYQVNLTSKKFFQVFIHSKKLQSNRLCVVQDDKNVYIAVFRLFTSGIRPKKPCFQDWLSLEVIGYLSCHRLHTHVVALFRYVCKNTIFSRNCQTFVHFLRIYF